MSYQMPPRFYAVDKHHFMPRIEKRAPREANRNSEMCLIMAISRWFDTKCKWMKPKTPFVGCVLDAAEFDREAVVVLGQFVLHFWIEALNLVFHLSMCLKGILCIDFFHCSIFHFFVDKFYSIKNHCTAYFFWRKSKFGQRHPFGEIWCQRTSASMEYNRGDDINRHCGWGWTLNMSKMKNATRFHHNMKRWQFMRDVCNSNT